MNSRLTALLFFTAANAGLTMSACAHKPQAPTPPNAEMRTPAASASAASSTQLEVGRKAIQSMTGCYLVDYSYTETEALKKGYKRDARIYDVTKSKAVKEWIYADEISP